MATYIQKTGGRYFKKIFRIFKKIKKVELTGALDAGKELRKCNRGDISISRFEFKKPAPLLTIVTLVIVRVKVANS